MGKGEGGALVPFTPRTISPESLSAKARTGGTAADDDDFRVERFGGRGRRADRARLRVLGRQVRFFRLRILRRFLIFSR